MQQEVVRKEIVSPGEENVASNHHVSRRSTMDRVYRSIAFSAMLIAVMFLCFGNTAAETLPGQERLLSDSLVVDNFNRITLDGVWTADTVYQIVSDELANTDVSFGFDDLAVFNAIPNPVGVSFQWGLTADSEGMQKGGLALMLDAASTSASGYWLFKHAGANNYKLWVIDHGVLSYQVDSSPTSEYAYYNPGDKMQVAYSSDDQGHHFDIFVNDRFDVRVTDPGKVFGNVDTLYAGVMLEGGGWNNNVDDFTFWVNAADTTPPNQVGDLDLFSRTANTVTLVWTAPGNDDSTGTAVTYDVRYSSSLITESNFVDAARGFGEQAPSISGSTEYFEVTGLDADARYYFAMRSDDGFPQRNVSAMSNVIAAATLDNIPPAGINDLTVVSTSSRTALLTWTATGDNGTEGMASSYDVRYSTLPITEGNFTSAPQAVGEPTPQVSGSTEEFTVGGLQPSTIYYFALKAKDEAGNISTLSFVPDAQTISYPMLVDDFERVQIGPDWDADPEYIINNGELSNEASSELWDYMAVYQPATGAEYVSLRWGSNADPAGIGEGGMALMLDSPTPTANGYLIFRHFGLDRYQLFELVNGAPSGPAVGSSPDASQPFPQAGDEFSVVMSSDSNGNHFDCYINGIYDTRVTDPLKTEGNADSLWAGVMLHGNRNNNVEDFWVSGPGANIAPGQFSLLSPGDNEIVDTGVPLLDWEDSIDPNLGDSVLYTLSYGTSASFDPDSTTVVDNLSASEYTVPPMSIIELLRRNGQSSFGSASKKVTDETSPEGLADDVSRVKSADDGTGAGLQTLPDDVVIYWKVKAFDTVGLWTMSLQEDWSFTVSIPEPPLPFGLLTPLNGDTVTTQTPTLSWEATSDPDPGDQITYTLYYDDEAGLPNPVVISGLTSTTFATPALTDSTIWFWKVEAVDSKDLRTESNDVYSFLVLASLSSGDDAGSRTVLPRAFALSQNYPNPFNPSTSIRYDIPDVSGEASTLIQVYSLRGQLIRTLVDGPKAPGSYVVHWDGRNEAGEKAGSGIYLYRIQSGAFSATKKMVVLK